MLSASEIRPGMVLRVEGDLYRVISSNYQTGGGKLGGVAHTKLRKLETGATWERRFRAEETIEEVEPERQTMQFLYGDESMSTFMHPESFEQVQIENARLGPAGSYLKPEMELPIEFVDARPVGVRFPPIVELRVEQTPPPIHSQGGDNVWKDAVLENGVEIKVPPFIAPGELVRVEVETGTYVERAKTGGKK